MKAQAGGLRFNDYQRPEAFEQVKATFHAHHFFPVM
jgi:hypothetical protein